jgi:hypothetical protein
MFAFQYLLDSVLILRLALEWEFANECCRDANTATNWRPLSYLSF